VHKLEDYAKQLRDAAVGRVKQLEQLRMNQAEEEKRQREHAAALDALRRQKAEKERQDLESLQELERLQREKERLEKRGRDQKGEMERLQQDLEAREQRRREEEARIAEAQEKLKKQLQSPPKQLQSPPRDARDDDDNMSVMSDMTDVTMASRADEPATELNEKEKEKWAKEGKSELDKKYFGIFSRSRHGRYQECERILKTEVDGAKVPVDCRDEFDNTPLIVACQNGKKRLAKLFLRYKANINAVNGQGNSVLHYCFTYGYGDLGDYLISKGANAALKNNNGLTCYDGLDQIRQASAVRIGTARSKKT
jgi:DNA repair exonuclease SbcCD ATPase subunit